MRQCRDHRSSQILRIITLCGSVFVLILLMPFLLLSNATAEPAADDTANGARAAWLEKEWRKLGSVGSANNQTLDKKNRFTCRETMDYAVECAQSYPDRAEKMIELTRSMQDLDPSSKTFGNFAWYSDQDKPGDLNAAEFVMQHALILWHKERNSLSDRARKMLRDMMKDASVGIVNHK